MLNSAGGNCSLHYDWFAITKRIVSYDGTTNAQEQDFSYTTTWPSHQSYQWTTKTTTVTTKDCHYVPRNNTLHVVLVDEADQMTPQAQLAFLSKLDGTAFPPQTVFIFTANDKERLQDRFLSRCMTLQFSSHGMAKDIAGLLENIWRKEAGETLDKPNFLRAAQDSKNNVRDAVNSLQVELLAL